MGEEGFIIVSDAHGLSLDPAKLIDRMDGTHVSRQGRVQSHQPELRNRWDCHTEIQYIEMKEFDQLHHWSDSVNGNHFKQWSLLVIVEIIFYVVQEENVMIQKQYRRNKDYFSLLKVKLWKRFCLLKSNIILILYIYIQK